MYIPRKLTFFLCCVLFLIGLPTTVWATDDGIGGVVVDRSGWPLTELPLVLESSQIDEHGHVTWVEQATAVTDQTGAYLFPAIDPADTANSSASSAIELYTEPSISPNPSDQTTYRVVLADEADHSLLDFTIIDSSINVYAEQRLDDGRGNVDWGYIMNSVTDGDGNYTELRQKLTFYTRVKMLICAAAEYTY